MIAGNSCNPCGGGQMMGMVMVPMVVPGGAATPGTAPDGVGTAFDFNSLTAPQKDQIVSIVETGYDFNSLTAPQKSALIAALGIGSGGAGGAGGAAGVDGIAPAFDLSTLTAAQKAALVTIVAAGLDFSTLTAAQKAQIQAIAGTGAATPMTAAQLDALLKTLYTGGAAGAILQLAADGTVDAVPFLAAAKAGAPGTAVGDTLKWDGTNWIVGPVAVSGPQIAAAIVAAPASTPTGANVPTSLAAVTSAGTLVETAIVPLPFAIPATYGPLNNPNAAPGTVIPVASVTVPADGWYIYSMSTAGNIFSRGLPLTIADILTLYATNGPLASGKHILGINIPMTLQAAKTTVAGELLAAFRYSGPSQPFYATAGTEVNTALYTPGFVAGVTFQSLEAVSPNSLQRISGNYLV